MSHAITQARRGLAPQSPHHSPAAVAAFWQDLVGSWRAALARMSEPEIDEATLRDLGISRSELRSFQAEADGRVEATRLRVLMGGPRF